MKPKLIPLFLQLHRLICKHPSESGGLIGGKLGEVLYYYSIYKTFDKPYFAEKAVQLLEDVLASIAEDEASFEGYALSTGSAGLLYTITLLQQDGLVEIDIASQLGGLDSDLVKTTIQNWETSQRGDLLYGLAGVVHYFSLRLNEPVVQQYLSKLLHSFFSRVQNEEQGCWFKNNFTSSTDQEDINFSLSHGLSGILLVLLNLIKKGFEVPGMKSIVIKGIEFILAQQNNHATGNNGIAEFPMTIPSMHRENLNYHTRLAWCYGDLNILNLLYTASNTLNEIHWKKIADDIGNQVILRKHPKTALVSDSQFCHGYAGIAQCYQNLFAISANEIYNTAYNDWLDLTLSALPGDIMSKIFEKKASDLLEGYMGINLVFLSCMSKEKLDWTKLLLI